MAIATRSAGWRLEDSAINKRYQLAGIISECSAGTVMQNLRSSLLMIGLLVSGQAAVAEVPAVEQLQRAPEHYYRATPWVALAGAPVPYSVPGLKQQGFKVLIDLRRPPEGIEDIAQAAHQQHLAYFNLPLGRERPEAELIQQFADIMAAHPQQEVLLYCASGNRAGTVWAMYRVQQGVSAEMAIEEGLAAGMRPQRSDWIKEWARQLAEQ